MSEADSLIYDLDRALEESGSPVTLRRLVGTQAIRADVKLLALLRGYNPSDMVGDIIQQDQQFIISPTEIDEKQWPGPRTGQSSAVDQRIPVKNDQIITPRGTTTVQAAQGLYVQGVLVRIEGRTRG